jgi:hypothetical protein
MNSKKKEKPIIDIEDKDSQIVDNDEEEMLIDSDESFIPETVDDVKGLKYIDN